MPIASVLATAGLVAALTDCSYRLLTMSNPSDKDFGEWADWFKCLADPTRLKILHLVSLADEPITVGEVVDQIGKSQSTVSKHLQILAEQRFVFTEADGIRTLVRANELCMTELPAAAAAIMGADRTS